MTRRPTRTAHVQTLLTEEIAVLEAGPREDPMIWGVLHPGTGMARS